MDVRDTRNVDTVTELDRLTKERKEQHLWGWEAEK